MTTNEATPRALVGLMNVLWFKIVATVLFWCLPLLAFPVSTLETMGFPRQDNWMFLRMLGWAYLALCVGYAFALHEARRGRRLIGTIWVGIVSNAGACAWLLAYGWAGTWATWAVPAQVILWGSAVATAMITWGLVRYGLR